ncbi:MAG: PD-(D/E)XK nuclease family protein, partial [Rickettsiales bacterium]|nr:PD-(D/E)XK nuclease family protein [Rickettsiales bacterium]
KPSIWLEALAGAAAVVDWPTRALPHHESLRIIPCAHAEEEVRVICLLLREGLENPSAHSALITPDEGLLARIATHMQRYGIMVDRLNAGTLANTETGSAWLALVAAIREPERQLPLRELLHHPLLAVDEALLQGLEKGWYGLNRSRAGQLPRHDVSLAKHPNYTQLVALVQQLAQLNRASMRVSEWLTTLEALLAPWQKQPGKAMDAVNEQLEVMRHADALGPMGIDDLSAVLAERLSSKWRDAGIDTHPRVHLLTPVEARLQHFDRVILANMQEQHWPGSAPINPWLNRAAEKALGLPGPEERISLMAHDVLMLASSGEVFLAYPKRDGGSPTTRSRFIERLVTLYAMHGIDESAITASHYTHWAQALYASDSYAPEMPITPLPRMDERPTRLSVTSMDRLFSDPFSIYAKYVLGLCALDALDADPEASDFGSLTHRALEQLTQHWNDTHIAATESQLAAIAQTALRAISERPNIDLFWRARLMGGLRYVNGLETLRRQTGRVVISEHEVESTVTLSDEGEASQTITLHGRIDRLETGTEGTTIIDYKTGDMPSKNKILEGKALQLLVYAMLLENTGQAVAGVEYWQLPKLDELGETLRIEAHEMPNDVPQKLRAALTQMLDPATPFLARPLTSSNDDRFGNDYDGISRYDEWAG